LLDEADFFETAHKSAAQSGQSAVPTDLENVEEHFITFIEAENDKGLAFSSWAFSETKLTSREKRVVEMDGGRTGPFDRGPCSSLLEVS
jgi:ubiquitin carboxyl-terminal hydrolase L3